MGKTTIIEVNIRIKASVKKVWEVFTNPDLSRVMGGEYICDWKPGSDFGWKSLEGKMLTKGILLEIRDNEMLKHNLFEIDDESKISSIITYRFQALGKETKLEAIEEIHYEMTEEMYKDAIEGWNTALYFVKEIAEKGI